MENLTIDDIINARFHKANIGGYKAEEVDVFVDNVHQTFINHLNEIKELKQKLSVLAKKIDQYRQEESSINTTMLSAQKFADSSIREAKHKAEIIQNEAKHKAEKIVEDAKNSILNQEAKLLEINSEVAKFRTKMIILYKEHLKQIGALPKEDFDLGNKDEKSNKQFDDVKNIQKQMDELEKKRKSGEFNELETKEDNKSESTTTKTSEIQEHDNPVKSNSDEKKEEQNDNKPNENNKSTKTSEPNEINETNETNETNKTSELNEPNKQPSYATRRFNAIKFGEDYSLDEDK